MRRHLGFPPAVPPPRRVSRFRRVALLGMSLSVVLALAGPALAQSPEEIKVARQTAGDGLVAYRAGQFDKALSLFAQARAVYPSAQILRMVGYTELALDHWQKSLEALEASLKSTVGTLPESDRKDVQEQLNKVLVHFGSIHVSSRAPDATVSVDGGPAQPLPLDKPLRLLEGKHTVTVTAPDHLDATQDVTVVGGKRLELPIEPEKKPEPPPPPPPKPPPAPPPPPPPPKPWIPAQRPIGFGLAGTGVALGVGAVITAISAAQIRASVAENVDVHTKRFGNQCTGIDRKLCQFEVALINHDADRADALRDATIGLSISAGVLAAGGAVLLIFAPRESPKPAPASGLAVQCGPFGSVGLACAGAF
jgi:hypothetical protein